VSVSGEDSGDRFNEEDFDDELTDEELAEAWRSVPPAPSATPRVSPTLPEHAWPEAYREWDARTRRFREAVADRSFGRSVDDFEPRRDRQDLGVLLRSVRRWRRLSQRELAQLAGVDRAVLSRIEAGQRDGAAFRTVERLLGAAGYYFLVVNSTGRPLLVDHPDDGLRDRAYRRFPAHLVARQVRRGQWWDPWWGWYRRKSWDRETGFWCYDPRPRGGSALVSWEDAT
jgi:transcriptional regulator with XRE-family HTH domain